MWLAVSESSTEPTAETYIAKPRSQAQVHLDSGKINVSVGIREAFRQGT